MQNLSKTSTLYIFHTKISGLTIREKEIKQRRISQRNKERKRREKDGKEKNI